MFLRYVYNGQPVAEGERSVVYQGGKMFVRTGVLPIVGETITYRLREVYADQQFPMEIIVPTATETLSRQLIPIDSAFSMKDLTVNSVSYAPDWAPDSPLIITSGIYTLAIAPNGYGTVSWNSADAALLPANNVTVTAFTISQFRVRQFVNGVEEVSAQKGPVLIRVKGQTVATDTTPPVLQSVSPSGTSIPVGSDITIVFDEAVVRGTGNLTIRNATLGTTIETLSLASAPTSGAGSIAISGNVVTVNPTSNLPAGTVVSIRYDAGAFKDAANNNVVALSDDSRSFTTASGSGGGSTSPTPGGGGLYVVATPDATVGTAADARTTLLSWSADWNGTVPAGKTASDWRVLGLTGVFGGLDLSGITLPQRVYVRHVGSFNSQFQCTSYIQGQPSISNSTNIWLYLLDIRSPSNAAFNNGFISADNTTDCGMVRCSLTGWPFTVVQGATGTNRYAYVATGSTRWTAAHNTYRYFADGFLKNFGTHNQPTYRGNMGLYSGGDDYTAAGNGAVLNDPLFEANFFDRHHAKVVGNHNDGLQVNSGGIMNRCTSRYNVLYRGVWTGVGEVSQNGWQGWYTGGAGTVSNGPTLAEHNLYINGQQRGIDRPSGHTNTFTVRYCGAIDSNVDATQKASAPYPSIRGSDAPERNFVVVPNAAFNSQEGTNGLRVTVAGGDYSPLLTYMENIPTDTTDLWAIRPKAGSRYHPAYTPAADRVGPFDFWEKMLAGDPAVCLSKVGWPVAPLFIADFDTGANFWNGYTGNFDENGDNI